MADDSKKEVSENDLQIVFYCKDCNEIVETSRIGKKYVYTCNKCGTKNVAFGTQRSVVNYFRMDEVPPKKAMGESDSVVSENTTDNV